MGGTISSMMTTRFTSAYRGAVVPRKPSFNALPPCGPPLLAPSSRIRIRVERAALRVPPRKTTRRAYLFPVPCEFLTAIAASPWCIALVHRRGAAQRNGSDAHRFAGATTIEEK
jgi:hypothetical protein